MGRVDLSFSTDDIESIKLSERKQMQKPDV